MTNLGNKKLYSFGNNFYGSLGVEEAETVWKPQEVTFFKDFVITEIHACGYQSFVKTRNQFIF